MGDMGDEIAKSILKGFLIIGLIVASLAVGGYFLIKYFIK